MTLSRTRVPLQPSGRDTLEVRQRYLRRQRTSSRDMLLVGVWIALGAIACFVGTAGLMVLVVGSR